MRGTIILTVILIATSYGLSYALAGTGYEGLYCPLMIVIIIIMFAAGNWHWIKHQLGIGRSSGGRRRYDDDDDNDYYR